MVLVLPAGRPIRRPRSFRFQESTSPPPEHHADPSLKTYVSRVGPFSIGGYQTFRHNDVVKPPPVAGSIVGMDARIVLLDPSGADVAGLKVRPGG